jgi:hypothetical protein
MDKLNNLLANEEPKQKSTWPAICYFIIGLFIVSLLALIFLYKTERLENEKSFEREIGVTLLQIISVAVIGTMVSLLTGEYSRKREAADKRINAEQLKKESENLLRNELVRKIHKLYGDTKKARRMLRARAFTEQYYKVEKDTTRIKAKEYDLYVEIIDSSQLELEFISKQIELNSKIFNDIKRISEYIKSINKDFFDPLISEYEINRPTFSGSPETSEIKDLHYLKQFLAERKKSVMFSKFICCYKNLIMLINNDSSTLADCEEFSKK